MKKHNNGFARLWNTAHLSGMGDLSSNAVEVLCAPVPCGSRGVKVVVDDVRWLCEYGPRCAGSWQCLRCRLGLE